MNKGKLTVNGFEYEVEEGDVWVVIGKDIYLNHRLVAVSAGPGHGAEVKIEGVLDDLHTQGRVTVNGDVAGSVNTQGSVTVSGAVGVNINTQGAVNVGGDCRSINAMGAVTVKGNCAGKISTMGRVGVGSNNR